MNAEVIEKLWKIIEDRKNNPEEGSYTCKLFNDPEKLKGKILEEAQELVETESKEGKNSIQWESADLLYHMLVYLAANDVQLQEVLDELEGRMK